MIDFSFLSQKLEGLDWLDNLKCPAYADIEIDNIPEPINSTGFELAKGSFSGFTKSQRLIIGEQLVSQKHLIMDLGIDIKPSMIEEFEQSYVAKHGKDKTGIDAPEYKKFVALGLIERHKHGRGLYYFFLSETGKTFIEQVKFARTQKPLTLYYPPRGEITLVPSSVAVNYFCRKVGILLTG